MSSVAPLSHPSLPGPKPFKKLGRGCLSQRQGEGNNDPGDGKILGLCQSLPGVMTGRRQQEAHCITSSSPLRPQASHFPFFLPCWLAKPDIWPSVLPQLLQVLQAKAAQAGVTRDPAGDGGGEGRGSSWGSLAVSSLQDFLPA